VDLAILEGAYNNIRYVGSWTTFPSEQRGP
jgi:hypothetical protein